MSKDSKITIILLTTLILLLSVLAACGSNSSQALVQSESSSLGQKLVFPKGYHLVTMAIYNTDVTTKTVYVCQSNDDPTDYRVCIPETK